MTSRYELSEQFLDRALAVIPLASQTFSKSLVNYPRGAAPLFIERGEGAYVWDIDGNRYLDCVNSLCAVTLGYCQPEIDQAVATQMKNGVSFSLPHRLETEVAELLTELIPCAESVRFGKNGTDATSAAIRIARAATGREHIAVCGYHGWQDWYIGSTTRHLGVPQAVRDLTHKFDFNNLASLEAIFANAEQPLAAVIMELMNVSYPTAEFLEGVRALCDKHGTVLIFDETITGFRFDLKGAQHLFGVTPDLATFGKGIANGYPLSAVVGKKHYMKWMEDIFFSGTFGGETLSLAAAKAVLTHLKQQDVIGDIRAKGEYLLNGLNSLIESKALGQLFGTAGHPSWSFLLTKETNEQKYWQVKTYLVQSLAARGFLCIGSHNISAAMSYQDLDALLGAYAEILPACQQMLADGTLPQALQGATLQPLFKVR